MRLASRTSQQYSVTKQSKFQASRKHLPAEFLDEILCVLGDLPGKVDRVDPLKDEVVRLHWVCAGEGRAAQTQQQNCKHGQQNKENRTNSATLTSVSRLGLNPTSVPASVLVGELREKRVHPLMPFVIISIRLDLQVFIATR